MTMYLITYRCYWTVYNRPTFCNHTRSRKWRPKLPPGQMSMQTRSCALQRWNLLQIIYTRALWKRRNVGEFNNVSSCSLQVRISQNAFKDLNSIFFSWKYKRLGFITFKLKNSRFFQTNNWIARKNLPQPRFEPGSPLFSIFNYLSWRTVNFTTFFIYPIYPQF